MTGEAGVAERSVLLHGVAHSSQRQVAEGIGLDRRIGLLLLISWMVGLTAPIFSVLDNAFSGRDLILIAGGLFLVWKATKEIHHNVDPDPGPDMFDSGSRVGRHPLATALREAATQWLAPPPP